MLFEWSRQCILLMDTWLDTSIWLERSDRRFLHMSFHIITCSTMYTFFSNVVCKKKTIWKSVEILRFLSNLTFLEICQCLVFNPFETKSPLRSYGSLGIIYNCVERKRAPIVSIFCARTSFMFWKPKWFYIPFKLFIISIFRQTFVLQRRTILIQRWGYIY